MDVIQNLHIECCRGCGKFPARKRRLTGLAKPEKGCMQITRQPATAHGISHSIHTM